MTELHMIKDEIQVKVRHEAHAVGVPGGRRCRMSGAGKKGAQQTTKTPIRMVSVIAPLHVGALADGAGAWQDRDPLNVEPGHEEHVDVERRHESQHGEEHGDRGR